MTLPMSEVILLSSLVHVKLLKLHLALLESQCFIFGRI